MTFPRHVHSRLGFALLAAIATIGLVAVAASLQQTPAAAGVTVFTNATLVSGDGPLAFALQDNATIIVRNGKVEAVGPPRMPLPVERRTVDPAGRFFVPGLISAHAHVSDVNGLKPRAYTDDNTRRQLGVFARYGITSVGSLGGEQAPAFTLRNAQSTPDLDLDAKTIAMMKAQGAAARMKARALPATFELTTCLRRLR